MQNAYDYDSFETADMGYVESQKVSVFVVSTEDREIVGASATFDGAILVAGNYANDNDYSHLGMFRADDNLLNKNPCYSADLFIGNKETALIFIEQVSMD
jgi:hypothetical protein